MGINIDHRLICFHALHCLLSLFLQCDHQGGRVCSLPAGNKSKIFLGGGLTKYCTCYLCYCWRASTFASGSTARPIREDHIIKTFLTSLEPGPVEFQSSYRSACRLSTGTETSLFFNLHCSHTSDLRVLGLSCPLAVSLSCSFPSCPRPPASHHWLYPICSWNFDYFLLCIINSSLQYFIQWACFFGGKTFNSVLHDMILVFFSSSILFLL